MLRSGRRRLYFKREAILQDLINTPPEGYLDMLSARREREGVGGAEVAALPLLHGHLVMHGVAASDTWGRNLGHIGLRPLICEALRPLMCAALRPLVCDDTLQ